MEIYEQEWEQASKRLEEDAADPFKRWVQAAFCVLTRNYDYAYRPQWTRDCNEEGWGFKTKDDLQSTLADLESKEENAANLLRVILVARQGVGLGLLDNEESWARLELAARKLQKAYGSWDEMAEAYMTVRRGWYDLAADGSQDESSDAMVEMKETIEIVRGSRWSKIAYDQSW